MTDHERTRALVEAVRLGLEAAKRDTLFPQRNQETDEALAALDRELRAGMEPLQSEWARLGHVEGASRAQPDDPGDLAGALAERRRKLCADIRSGHYDDGPARAALYEHLVASARAELELVDPGFLADLATEERRHRRRK